MKNGMEELVKELRHLMEFKDMLQTGDVAVIAGEEPQMLAFAVVTDIVRDTTRRDEWWHVSMQMLSVPLQPMTWTLRTEQMTGREIFTMGGKKMFMAPVHISFGTATPEPGESTDKSVRKSSTGRKKTVLRVVK